MKGIFATLVYTGHDTVEIRAKRLSFSEFKVVLESALDMPGVAYYIFPQSGKKLSWDELNSRNIWDSLYLEVQVAGYSDN